MYVNYFDEMFKRLYEEKRLFTFNHIIDKADIDTSILLKYNNDDENGHKIMFKDNFNKITCFNVGRVNNCFGIQFPFTIPKKPKNLRWKNVSHENSTDSDIEEQSEDELERCKKNEEKTRFKITHYILRSILTF